MGQFIQRVLDLFDTTPPLASASNLANPNKTQSLANPGRPGELLSQALPLAQFAHPRASRRIALATCDVAYAFRRAKRRTIGMVIGPDGLEVSAPRWVTVGEIESTLHEKADWIVRKLVEMQEHQRRLGEARIQWRDGVVLRYLGASLQVVLDSSAALKKNSAQLETLGNESPASFVLRIGLPITASPEQIRDATQAWLMRRAKELFAERLDYFAPRLGVAWKRLSLSSASTRWGTASADGAIRLNWRLIHHKLDVIDYVVAHELSHLKVMDHSPQFWETVKSVMPDYPERRRVLRDEPLAPWG
ncbi:MAG: SprT family zinc-dependent metalloprotease [Burkholderiales bacterium]|nr:SprT family zinc-dependent metalloprotease [Burkholderiales bacterium]